MTICSYYLKGTCRFGERCRYEHIDPEHSEESYGYNNRRNDNSYGYHDRYRQQGNYQNRQNKYEDQDLSFGPRRYGNNERQYQNYGSQRYQQQQYSQNYDRNEIYSSSPQHSYSSRYDTPLGSNSSRGNSNYYQNKYGRNQYEWVSEDYKKRQQSTDSPINRSYSPSQVSFSFKDTEYEENKESVSEKTLNLSDRIKEDIIAWELGNQWPFTCYFPLTEKEGFTGFSDISFEELRYETLKAKENNSFDVFAEMVNKSILDINRRREQLKQPTDKLLSIIDKLRKGEKLNNESTIGGLSFMNSTQVIAEPLDADDFSNQTGNTASSFSFKLPGNDQLPSSTLSFAEKKTSTFSFRDVVDKDNKSGASSFSFKLPASDKLPSSTLSSTESSLYTAMEELSELDKEQFTASTFTLGKIPTVPPPKVLCF